MLFIYHFRIPTEASRFLRCFICTVLSSCRFVCCVFEFFCSMLEQASCALTFLFSIPYGVIVPILVLVSSNA